MQLKKICMVGITYLGFTMVAHANEVLLTTNQPIKITFRVAHKNKGGEVIFDELQTINVSKNVSIPVDLKNYDRAGIVIISGNGHELPPSANQFDQPKQCSMTTDKVKSTGALEFILSDHAISCRTYGGVFGL